MTDTKGRIVKKSAVALFVKDEIYDIAGWISWYVSLGFEKIYIYDDHSTDGTYEVCLAASSIYDIEVFRTDIKKETNFFWRQRDSYFDACRRACGKYEWIALLDCDEYISLDGYQSINDFLNKFENFNGIALNWCIYGSSSRVIKDHIPVYDAFIAHSNYDFGDNRLVKSIIRPNNCNFQYTDPHRFYMNNECYADSLCDVFDWQGSTKNVLWEGARVNHYICRSMEHYVSRIKRRLGVDLHNSVVYWDHFNRNEIIEAPNPILSKKSNNFLERIKETIIKNYLFEVRFKNKISLSSNIKCSAKVFLINDYLGNQLCLNNIDGHIISEKNTDCINNKIYGVKYENENKIYILSIVNGTISNVYFHISDYNKKSYCYMFNLIENNDGTFFIFNKSTEKYLCSVQNETLNEISCNREIASDWEKFTLTEVNSGLEFGFCSFQGEKFEEFISYLCSDFTVSVNDFYISSSNLSCFDLDKLKNENNKVLSWIL